MDIFLDLACPDSAAAWPILKQTAEDYADVADFAFRIFPLPFNHFAFDAAKVMGVNGAIRTCSAAAYIITVITSRYFVQVPEPTEGHESTSYYSKKHLLRYNNKIVRRVFFYAAVLVN